MAKLKTGRHTSAIKADRQAAKRKYRNRAMVKKAKEDSKSLLVAASSGDKGQIDKLVSAASSSWDKAVKSGGVHWKTAARRKSRLAKKASTPAPKKA